MKSIILQIKNRYYKLFGGSDLVAIVKQISYKTVLPAFATNVRFHNKKGEALL